MIGRLLSMSYDKAMLEARHLLLRQAGNDVVSTEGFVETLEHCSSDYDLVILGHSVPQRDKRTIVAELRRHGCDAPVLCLIRHGQRPIPEATRGIEPVPQLLLDTVQALRKSQAGTPQSSQPASDPATTNRVLRSWKDIARYLSTSVSTVQRWERLHHLPVHRIAGRRRASVFASEAELQKWLKNSLS